MAQTGASGQFPTRSLDHAPFQHMILSSSSCPIEDHSIESIALDLKGSSSVSLLNIGELHVLVWELPYHCGQPALRRV